jgi:hypothetical protein
LICSDHSFGAVYFDAILLPDDGAKVSVLKRYKFGLCLSLSFTT